MLAHQLSAFSKLPPEHPRALGLELCVGGPTLSVVAPGPSTESGGALSMEPNWLGNVPWGLLHIWPPVHLATREQRKQQG